ncbi:hypothetical protein FACS189483_03960 [Spirochaetia bacterium]|nr:hypothetical protein FACS189483_03960 [Spirochaetia bacterium]
MQNKFFFVVMFSVVLIATGCRQIVDSIPTLDSISVESTKATYIVGDSIDISTVSVTGNYSDGTTKPIEITAENLAYDFSSAGTKTVTVTAQNHSATFEVTVANSLAMLDSISVESTKTIYFVGESIDISTISVTGNYSDGTAKTIEITAENLTYDFSSAGTKTVVVTVQDKSAEITITVSSATIDGIAIENLPVKTNYLLGEVWDFSGLTVKAIYSDGAENIIEAYSIQGDTFTAGTRTVTVTFENQSATFNIVVANTLINTGLPVIYINTENSSPITSKENYIKMNFQIVDTENPANNVEKTGFKDNIRGRGNTSWGYPKKPYRIKFDSKTALFGLEKAKSWVLLASYGEPTLLMNATAFELGNRLGLPYTNHYKHVEVVLNGTYQGSYVLTEQVQVGKGRVDIDEDDGFLVELDVYYDEEPKFRSDIIGLPVMIKSPEDLPDPNGYDFVKTAINALESAMFDDTFPESGYRDLIDMDTFVDFMLINEIVGNGELGHPKSTYMYKDDGGKISMGPLWDFDWAFGGSPGNYFANGGRLFGQGYTGSNVGPKFFWRFFDDPAFRAAYKTAWNDQYAVISTIPAFIDTMAALLEQSAVLNARRWGAVDYSAQISAMKTWWNNRVAYLNSEINK